MSSPSVFECSHFPVPLIGCWNERCDDTVLGSIWVHHEENLIISLSTSFRPRPGRIRLPEQCRRIGQRYVRLFIYLLLLFTASLHTWFLTHYVSGTRIIKELLWYGLVPCFLISLMMNRKAIIHSLNARLLSILCDTQVVQEIHVQLSEMSNRCNELVAQTKVSQTSCSSWCFTGAGWGIAAPIS